MEEDEANDRLFNADDFIQPLLTLLYRHDMILALPKGLPTYKTTTGNWTRPDNIWRTNTADDPIICCDVLPVIRPPLADHLPIITILDLPLPRSNAPKTCNFRQADWPTVCAQLDQRLKAESPATLIKTRFEFLNKVDTLVQIISSVLEKEIPETKPSPHVQCWWTKELTDLKKHQNRLSNKHYKLRHIADHPIIAEHKAATAKFKRVLKDTRDQHWKDWLEAASQCDIYIANKYLSSEPTDFSLARIPSLHTNIHGFDNVAETNEAKAEALAHSFFPLPPGTSSVPSNFTYPRPLPGIKFFSRHCIRQAIKKLSLYKAPRPDGIPNVVLIKCVDVLIDHLFFIYRATFELNVYHPRWRESITVVLRKIGKAAYDLAKAYRPIGLIDTIGKLHGSLSTELLSYITKKYNLLPKCQFGGRPGRNTTDTMLLVAQRVKHAWRNGKVAAALFLDVQGAFPNIVKEQVIHNMRTCRVPKCFIDLVAHVLTDHYTRFRFDDYISERIPIKNGTTQGDPQSMLYYAFYNAPLIEIAHGLFELSPGFVDDSMMLAITNSLSGCHTMLKDMMERSGGGFDWSHTHNSPYELSKVRLMNFPRSFRDAIPTDLVLHKPNPDGSVTASPIKTITSYKYLGVIFDSKLHWTLHQAKVLANTSFWSSQVWRLSCTASGLPFNHIR
jgi:hypothetical protein